MGIAVLISTLPTANVAFAAPTLGEALAMGDRACEARRALGDAQEENLVTYNAWRVCSNGWNPSACRPPSTDIADTFVARLREYSDLHARWRRLVSEVPAPVRAQRDAIRWIQDVDASLIDPSAVKTYDLGQARASASVSCPRR